MVDCSDLRTNPQQLLTLMWIILQVVLVGYVVSSWAAAASAFTYDKCVPTKDAEAGAFDSPSIDHKSAFVLVWQSLFAIGISVVGTTTLKRYREATTIGVFLGVLLVFGQCVLMQAFLSGSEATRKMAWNSAFPDCPARPASADAAVVFFGAVMSLLYISFGVVLIRNRDEVLGGLEEGDGFYGSMNNEDDANFDAVPTI